MWKRRERKNVRMCEKENGCMRACEWLVHTMHFYALLHLYVLHRLFFVFLFVSSPLFSIINFPLRSFLSLSLSPHFTNSLKRTFRILLVRPLFSIHRHHNILSSPKSSNRTNVKSGVSALSSTSTAFGTAASNARLEQTGNGHIDEALRQQALAEEEAAMNQYKVPDCTVLLIIMISEWMRSRAFWSVEEFELLS